jgi:transcriptional regulator with PAS, ATPase and Fis domain
MNFNQPEIQSALNELPTHVRHAIETFDWSGVILFAGREFELGLDSLDIFHYETLLVALGKTAATDYEEHLRIRMKIPAELAALLVNFANQYIFKVLQKKAFQEKTEDPEEDPDAELLENIYKPKESSPKREDSGPLDNQTEHSTSEILDLDQTDFDLLYTKNGIIPGMVEQKKNAVLEKENIPEQKEKVFQDIIQESYQEIIEKEDLEGINKQRTNTSILKQENPENVLDVDIDDVLTPFKKQTKETHSLEQKILSTQTIPKKEHVVVRASDSDLTKEVHSFLDQLSS